MYGCSKDCLILIPLKLPQISCFTLSLKCFSSDSDNCPDVGIGSREGNGTPTTVLLPGKSHGRRSLVGCSPWSRKESNTTERLHFHFSLSCIGEGNGNPLQCSCLENPRDGGAWWAAVYGVTQSRTRLKWLSSSRDRIPASCPPPAESRSSPTNTPVFPPSSFVLPSFSWFHTFFSTGQVLLYALSWCSACTSVFESVFLMYLWREMYSTSTYSSAILFSPRFCDFETYISTEIQFLKLGISRRQGVKELK